MAAVCDTRNLGCSILRQLILKVELDWLLMLWTFLELCQHLKQDFTLVISELLSPISTLRSIVGHSFVHFVRLECCTKGMNECIALLAQLNGGTGVASTAALTGELVFLLLAAVAFCVHGIR